MVLQTIHTWFKLRSPKKVLRRIHFEYRKKAKTLPPSLCEELEMRIRNLHEAIRTQNVLDAKRLSDELLQCASRIIKKKPLEKIYGFVTAIAFALAIAVVIRQMWFELYTIPTGSMRPTLKESDLLIVSKTDFGLNVPLKTSHFYFDPHLVQRGEIVIFTGENMDIADADTTYFYLFPGKKQFVKRLMGKPGDLLYFYGGEIYGLDASGKELTSLRKNKWFPNMEHIPFIRFDGKVETPNHSQGIFHTAIFHQMNQPIATLHANQVGYITGEMTPQRGHAPLPHYSDLWGMKNYGMARLLNEAELQQIHPGEIQENEKGLLYLEITHHPSLTEGYMVRDEMNRIRPELGHSVSLLSLKQEHLDRIAHNMNTCRFVVEKGKAHRLGFHGKDPYYSKYFPSLVGVADGTYEIQNGEIYKVLIGGITQKVASDHPLYDKSAEMIHFLYNLGFEFLTQYTPEKNSRSFPSRYTYFRNHDLYLLGAPIVKKDDPALILFLNREYQKQSISTSLHPYLPFEDSGAPLTKEGQLDVDFIKKYGLMVPEKMYLVLGDNHAMSADSRQFGFVPQDNLKGGVSFLFSPPGSRWGRLPQTSHPHLTFSNLFVWCTTLFIGIGSSLYVRRRIAMIVSSPLRSNKVPSTEPN